MARGQIAIVKSWNGTATDGEKAVLAVRTFGEIDYCEWIHLESEEEQIFRCLLLSTH